MSPASALFVILSVVPAAAAVPLAPDPASLEGSWNLVSAYEIAADGTRTTNYSEHPHGFLSVDSRGRYSLQIFKPGRPAFASGDKTRGSADEYQLAVLGSSTHFGSVSVDPAAHQLRFEIHAASFPNWEGKTQVRDYELRDGLLRYAVPASASGNGTVAYSVWRRAE